jgi:hypothetical protein
VVNTASARLLQRVGFQREGVLRERFLPQGRFRDEREPGWTAAGRRVFAEYLRLLEVWPPREAAFPPRNAKIPSY